MSASDLVILVIEENLEELPGQHLAYKKFTSTVSLLTAYNQLPVVSLFPQLCLPQFQLPEVNHGWDY